MVHVPYKGSNLALIDLLAGRIQLNISTIAASLPHVRAGKLRALAVASRQRVAALRDTPTVAESGFPGYEAVAVGGTVRPRTHARRRARADPARSGRRAALSRDARRAGRAGVRARQARRPRPSPHASGATRARWRKVISDAGLKPD